MTNFVKLLSLLRRATRSLPYIPQLRTDEYFQSALLAPRYSVAKWRDDPAVDQVERQLFKTYAAQAPFLKNLPTTATSDFPDLYDYRFAGAECLGLGYAHLLRGIAVSLNTEECWKSNAVEIMAHYLWEGKE
jgi:hypothetical protein